MIQPLALNPFVTAPMATRTYTTSNGLTAPLLMAYDTHATALPNFGYSMHALPAEEIPGVGPAAHQEASTFTRLNVLA
jgi:hypothetical protein